MQVCAFLESGSHFVASPFKNFVIEDAGAGSFCPIRRARRSGTFPSSNSIIETQRYSRAASYRATATAKDSGKIDRRQGQGDPVRLFEHKMRGTGFGSAPATSLPNFE
jgi:hypothetical protein